MPHLGLTYDDDRWERWVLRGLWLPEYADHIRRSGLLALELNEVRGFQGYELGFLRDIPELQELWIVHHHLDDDSGVTHCVNLRKLVLNTYSRTSPEFGQLTQLQDCYIEWRPAATSLLQVETLHRLHVQNPPWEDLRALQASRGLVDLRFGSARRFTSMDGVESMRSLESFKVHGASKLSSLTGIESLDSLRSLEVNSCRKVCSLEPVRPLRRLQYLHLSEGGHIDSLLPIKGMLDLQELWFYGSTNVVDGRVKFLADMPSLREVRFQNRRHYDAKRDTIDAVLHSRRSRG